MIGVEPGTSVSYGCSEELHSPVDLNSKQRVALKYLHLPVEHLAAESTSAQQIIVVEWLKTFFNNFENPELCLVVVNFFSLVGWHLADKLQVSASRKGNTQIVEKY